MESKETKITPEAAVLHDGQQRSQPDARPERKEAAKAERKAAKKAAKAEKKAAKKAAKASKRTQKAAKKKASRRNRKKSILAEVITDSAADLIYANDVIWAGYDHFMSALKYNILFQYNDARTRYGENTRRMIASFFAMLVVSCIMLLAFDHNTVYQYSYNGRALGYVQDQENVNDIVSIAGEKLSEANDARIRFTVGDNITFRTVSRSGKDVDNTDQVLNKLTYMTEIDVEAYGIYEDGKLMTVVESERAANDVLDLVLSYYRAPDAGMTVQDLNFVNKVEIQPVNVLLPSVMTRSEAAEFLEEGGTLELSHIVMEGETESDIDQMYSVDSRKIEISEDDDNGTMDAGEKISMEREVDPIKVRMTESGTMSEVIEYKTVKKKTDTMYRGDTEVTQEGKNGRQTITGTLVYENGNEISRDIESSEVLEEAVDEIILVGTNDKPKWYPTGTFAMPIQNATITSYFGQRWGRLHAGIDFGASTGTPIYASDGGTVTRASYFSGYGLCVDVEHNDGTFTRYGHCSAVYVSVGDKVAQGEKIAAVGSTGNSTGPHLHFEIHPNGGDAVDPYPYLYGDDDE